MNYSDWVSTLHRLADDLAATAKRDGDTDELRGRTFLAASDARRLANRLDELSVLRELKGNQK